MTERWYTAAELLGTAGLPTRIAGINKAAKRNAWLYRIRPGIKGGAREYPLSVLPIATQAALVQRQLATQPAAAVIAMPNTGRQRRAPSRASVESLAAVYEGKPEGLKAEAQRRLAAVQAYAVLRAGGIGATAAKAATAETHQVSTATLARWLALVDGVPADKWLFALAPAYVGRTATADLSPEAWEVLKADYLRPEQPSASGCIYRLQRAALKHGWVLPAKRTLERRLEALPRALKTLARKGVDAIADAYPAQTRDKTALEALQWINADGYKHNVWVRFPDGEVCRPKTWAWQDVFSSKVLAWRVDKSEHTDVIRLSFGDLVETWGLHGAGTHALIDNTMAAANKTMTGGTKTRFRFKIKEEDALGVFPLMGVKVHWATPGHGQAKPVERIFGKGGFGEVIDRHPQFAGAYTGRNPLEKPENYAADERARQRVAIDLDMFLRVLGDEIAAFNAREGRRGSIAQGRSFDQVFTESYQHITVSQATEAQRRLWLLATEPVKAGAKDGALTLDSGRTVGERQRGANRYWAPALVEHAGRPLVARFDPQRLHEGVHVYGLDGRYITWADCFAPQGFADANAGREHTRARLQFVRSQKAGLEAERRMSVLEAAKYHTGADSPISPVINPVNPKVVAVKFGDPMRRPAAPAVPVADAEQLSAEHAAFLAEQAAVKDEIEKNANVIDGPDFVGRYRLANRLQKRQAQGQQLTAREGAWLSEYLTTPEYKDTHDMHAMHAGSA